MHLASRSIGCTLSAYSRVHEHVSVTCPKSQSERGAIPALRFIKVYVLLVNPARDARAGVKLFWFYFTEYVYLMCMASYTLYASWQAWIVIAV